MGMPATANKGRTQRVQGQVRLLVPPKIASSSTAPTVDTTIEGTLKPSSYRKPKGLER